MRSDLYLLLLNNDDSAYREIYKVHYRFINQFVLKNSGSDDDARDLFQECIIALWDNINSGKYTHSNDTMLHGYFRRICRLKWLDILRSKGKIIVISDDPDFDVATDETI